MAMQITTKHIKPGTYLITREDGRVFRVIRAKQWRGTSKTRWVISAEDTLELDDAPTLGVAKADIKNQWTPITKPTGRQDWRA